MRPGVAALILLSALAVTLGVQPLLERGVLEEAYSQVFVVACGESYGTGWWVNSRGYAVTAYHVVDDCGEIYGVRDPWASPMTLVAFSEELDVAVLRAAEPPEWARGLPLSYEVSVGDRVYVVGYPVQLYQETGDIYLMSRAPRVAEAVVAWLDPAKPLLEFEGSTDAGNSGGPVVSADSGGVVGIVVYAREGVVSTSFYAVRMDGLVPVLERAGVEYEVAGGPAGGLALLALAAAGAIALVLVLSGGVGRRG